VSFDVRHTVSIAAPTSVVWTLLSDLESWPRWWSDCKAARRKDRRPLAEGSQVELVLQPGGRERTLMPIVDLLTEGRGLTLVAQRLFFDATVSWQLREAPAETTRMSAHGAFGGLGSGRLGIGRDLLEASLRRHSRGLTQAAERLA